MKNIHILPTPNRKISNIGIVNGKLFISKIKEFGHKPQNIYITSDEEIKDYNWYISSEGKLLQFTGRNVLGDKFIAPRVILTTDPDLIENGVQAIDDEFLEWFVKNPSCEEVEIFRNWTSATIFDYEIIIPIREQSVQEYEQQGLEKHSYELEHKQETLEEVADNKFGKVDPILGKSDYRMGYESGLIMGAKWQAGISYSAEDIIDAWEMGAREGLPLTREKKEDLFKLFKKK